MQISYIILFCPSCDEPLEKCDSGVISDSKYYLGKLVCTPCTIDWDELYQEKK